MKTIAKQTLKMALFLWLALLASPAFAQVSGDAFAGFRSDNNSPIQIEADSLEVRDGEKIAVFKGNVDVRQGETVMRSAKLNVYYEGSVKPGAPGSSQGIRRIEAAGKVIVVSGNNKATGDSAVFNMRTQKVVLSGNVILSQCDNIIRGKQLAVDLTTGQANLTGTNQTAGKKGRVQALFLPGQSPDSGPSSKCN